MHAHTIKPARVAVRMARRRAGRRERSGVKSGGTDGRARLAGKRSIVLRGRRVRNQPRMPAPFPGSVPSRSPRASHDRCGLHRHPYPSASRWRVPSADRYEPRSARPGMQRSREARFTRIRSCRPRRSESDVKHWRVARSVSPSQAGDCSAPRAHCCARSTCRRALQISTSADRPSKCVGIRRSGVYERRCSTVQRRKRYANGPPGAAHALVKPLKRSSFRVRRREPLGQFS